MSVNKVIIMGRLGKDPELKDLPSGDVVCNFSVATSDIWRDKTTKEKREKTEWHNCVCFSKTAKNCAKYLSKGSQVYIEGSIQTRSWENKEGQKQYVTEIKASQVQFIGGRSEFTANDIPF
jgi:single-strand DNA-binding protein